jgi:transcriptional regulator, merR family
MNITEAGKQTSLTPNTLRYYERIGLIPPVSRNKGGTREYTSKDLCWIELSAGLTPETLIEYVALSQLGDTTLEARKDILELQREVLQEKMKFIQQTLARIDIKIENYRTDIYQKNHPSQNQKQEEEDL